MLNGFSLQESTTAAQTQQPSSNAAATVPASPPGPGMSPGQQLPPFRPSAPSNPAATAAAPTVNQNAIGVRPPQPGQMPPQPQGQQRPLGPFAAQTSAPNVTITNTVPPGTMTAAGANEMGLRMRGAAPVGNMMPVGVAQQQQQARWPNAGQQQQMPIQQQMQMQQAQMQQGTMGNQQVRQVMQPNPIQQQQQQVSETDRYSCFIATNFESSLYH